MAGRAKAEFDWLEKSCKTKDEKIACWKAEGIARLVAFKIERETMEKMLNDHKKNVDDFRWLDVEKSLELKASVIGLEAELQHRSEAMTKRERQLANAKPRVKGQLPIFDKDAFSTTPS